MKKKCYIFSPLLAACISELAFSFTSLLIKQQHLQLILLYRPGQRQLENKFNDLIFKQLLAIILQTNLQSHQLSARQTKHGPGNIRRCDLRRVDGEEIMGRTFSCFQNFLDAYFQLKYCKLLPFLPPQIHLLFTL